MLQQERSFDSVWRTELGPAQGPWHSLFSRNSSATPGTYKVDGHSVYATITDAAVGAAISNNSTTFQTFMEYRDRHFGCQSSLPGMVRVTLFCLGGYLDDTVGGQQ